MQVQPPVGRELGLDRDAREVVPEGHARPGRAEDAARQALLQVLDGIAGERLQQRQLDRPGHDRRGVEHAARRCAQRRDAREHRVADRRRQLDGARRERLGDEERVAGGAPVQRAGVDAVRRGQLGHRAGRQGHEPHAVGDVAAQEIAERDAQRVRRLELVVAVARDQQRRHARDPPRQQAQHVERRLVGPVRVLEHDDRRVAPGELAEHRGGHRVGRRARGHEVLELAAGDRADVHQRAERRGREECVAVAPQDARVLGVPLAEVAQQRRLADARLAGHEHQPAARLQRRVEHVERRVALEQRGLEIEGHGAILPLLGDPPGANLSSRA